MSIAADVLNSIKFSGDQESELTYSSGELADSPCYQQLVSLSTGNNTVSVPDVEDFTTHGLAIVPPDSNLVEPTLKGVAGDTGILLSASQVSVIHFGATPPASIVLSVDDDAAGFRLIWF